MPVMTKHARKRMKERNSITGFNADATMRNVLQKGVTMEEIHGELYDHLKQKLDNKWAKANIIRLYRGSVYFFAGGTLLTTYPLPEEYESNIKEYISPRAYIRYTHKPKELKGLTEAEIEEYILRTANELFTLRGKDFLAVSCTKFASENWKIRFVTDDPVGHKKNFSRDSDTIRSALGVNVVFAVLKDEDGKRVSRERWEAENLKMPENPENNTVSD